MARQWISDAPVCATANRLFTLIVGNLHMQWLKRCKQYTTIQYNTGLAKKTGLFLRSDDFETTDDRKACNMSKVSEFYLCNHVSKKLCIFVSVRTSSNFHQL